jgi:hypothetical protein
MNEVPMICMPIHLRRTHLNIIWIAQLQYIEIWQFQGTFKEIMLKIDLGRET